MNRRRFLGAFTATLPMAGCLSGDSIPGESNNSNETDPDTTTPEPGTRGAFTLGDSTSDVNPHRLVVRNDGDTSRTIELRITDADTDESLLDQSYFIEGGGEVAGELHGPATYEVQVAVPDTGTEHVTTADYFDTCNDYQTTVTVAPDGGLSSRAMKTDQECQNQGFDDYTGVF